MNNPGYVERISERDEVPKAGAWRPPRHVENPHLNGREHATNGVPVPKTGTPFNG